MNDQLAPVEVYDDLRVALRSGVARLISEQRHRRRRRRLVALVVAALASVSGLALAATVFVGSPAPDQVTRDIASVDAGMPDALRLNPLVRDARSVAATAASTLWVADLAEGGRCLELTTALYPDVRAPGCTTGAELGGMPITATLPNPDHARASDPVVIAGSVEPAAASLSLVLADGREIAVPFGARHFYVADLTGADALEVREGGVTVLARDASGRELARLTVPADWDASAADEARQATIDITTRSDSRDLTRVLGIDGVFRDPLPASLELRYGHDTVAIAVASDGSFHYDVPGDRQGDFMTPRRLVARDAEGRVLAERPIAAVAYWRTRAG